MHICTFASPLGTARLVFIDDSETHFLTHPRSSEALYPLQRSALFMLDLIAFGLVKNSKK